MPPIGGVQDVSGFERLIYAPSEEQTPLEAGVGAAHFCYSATPKYLLVAH